MKLKKVLSVLTAAVLSAAFVSTNVLAYDYDNTDIYFVVVDELDNQGKHNQWYTTDAGAFRTNGINVKRNGKEAESKFFSFERDVRPGLVYDGKNFDYEVPFNVIADDEPLDAKLPVKIGQEGDVNLDHKVDVRDSSAITRDLKYFKNNKKSELDDFGIYLGEPLKDGSAYSLTKSTAGILANKLAKEALDRASGKKYENKGESKYAVSISKANGLPGETVTLQVVVEADDEFESLDALIEWDDDTLKSAGAVSVNGTLCESYIEDGMVSVVDYSEGGVKDGAIASIDFVIPEDAKPGTSMDVYFSSIETFAVYKDGATTEESNVVNVVGATIGVMEPKQTTATTTTDTTTTTTTTTVTTVATTTESPVTTTENPVTTNSTVGTTVSESTTTTVVTTKPTTTSNVTTTEKPVTSTAATTITAPATTTVTTVPEAATTTTTNDTVIIKVQPGDANLDGKVDVRDAAYIAHMLSKGEGSMLHNVADYNRDGKINVRDAAAIARFLSLNIK